MFNVCGCDKDVLRSRSTFQAWQLGRLSFHKCEQIFAIDQEIAVLGSALRAMDVLDISRLDSDPARSSFIFAREVASRSRVAITSEAFSLGALQGLTVERADRGVLAAWVGIVSRKVDAVHTLWRSRCSPRDVIGLFRAGTIFFTNTAWLMPPCLAKSAVCTIMMKQRSASDWPSEHIL